eukprot:9595235-Karenia_brevis.AAC.1
MATLPSASCTLSCPRFLHMSALLLKILVLPECTCKPLFCASSTRSFNIAVSSANEFAINITSSAKR